MTNDLPPHSPMSKRKLLIGGAGALVVAVGVVVAFVLPAEYGIDPTGLGKAMGLTQIAEPDSTPELLRGKKRTGVLALSEAPPAALPGKTDHWEIELGPYESVEFKYTIAKGEKMAFAWKAGVPLRYDMHAHPFDGGVDLTESYSIDEASQMQGVYTAAFTGIHGWYWQNRTLEPVKLVLDASGAITDSTVFDAAGEHERPIGNPAR